MNTIIVDNRQTTYMLNFLGLAYKDYLAARTLLRTNQLFRGIILCCTAVEKYFKVFLAAEGKTKKTHDVLKLYEAIKDFDKGLSDSINEDFIAMLSNSYNMRYFDNDVFNSPTQEFSICVPKKKVLAELDYTVNLLENGWKFTNKDGLMKRHYINDLESKNELLFLDNYLLIGLNKDEFLSTTESVLELRNTKTMGVVEIYYQTYHSNNDGKFNIEALTLK